MSAIRIRTEIPGPRSQALMRRREAAVPARHLACDAGFRGHGERRR